MSNPYTPKIPLTPEETDLCKQIIFTKPYGYVPQEVIDASSDAAYHLMRSLINRNAIPDIRLRYFKDPNLNSHIKKSHQQIFEQNGTTGIAIFRHQGFIPFLKYFVFGPDLPDPVIEGFIQIVEREQYISGSDMPGLEKFARDETRRFDLVPHKASEEFYKLSLECGINKDLSQMIRNAIHTIR